MPTKASLDEYMGDIVKVRRSVHSSYGFMRIMAALSTFVYFPLFVSTAFVKDFVPHEFFMAYFLVLGMYVLVKIVKEAANKSFYLFDRREEDAGARRPEDPLSVRISFKIWPCNGIIKHIFSIWSSLAILFPILLVANKIWSIHFFVPENFFTVMAWVAGICAAGLLDNFMFILRIPKFQEMMIKFLAALSKGAHVKEAAVDAVKGALWDERQKGEPVEDEGRCKRCLSDLSRRIVSDFDVRVPVSSIEKRRKTDK